MAKPIKQARLVTLPSGELHPEICRCKGNFLRPGYHTALSPLELPALASRPSTGATGAPLVMVASPESSSPSPMHRALAL